jgi:hypothetical protein
MLAIALRTDLAFQVGGYDAASDVNPYYTARLAVGYGQSSDFVGSEYDGRL